MAGEDRLRTLSSIRVQGMGLGDALEQSERPEGPWVTTYRQFAELHDLAGGRLRRTEETKGFWQGLVGGSTRISRPRGNPRSTVRSRP